MREILILPSFERSVKKLSRQQKDQLAQSLEKFNDFVSSGIVPAGLGFKKTNHDKYGFRIGINLRVVLKEEPGCYILVLAGNHAVVRRYLKEYR